MDDFFENLGAAVRRTAGKVSNQVAITAQEQKVREAYQALGKCCYRLEKSGNGPDGDYYAALTAVGDALEKLRQLRDKDDVEPTAHRDDFVDADE